MIENDSPSSEDLSPAEVAAQIGSELFGGREPSGGGEPASSDTPRSSPSAPVEASPAPIPQGKALPKSWKKEMEEYWGKMDPAVHDYVYEREANVMRGFQQYADAHKQWNTLLEPYQGVFQQHKDVNPVQLMQGLMNTHLRLLSDAPPEQKREMLVEIAKAYGVDFATQVADNAAVSSPDPALVRRLEQAENQLKGITNYFTESQKRIHEQGVKSQLELVNKFATDPQNKYFEQVSEDILGLIQSGAAKDLPSAYELACLRNPDVRKKYLADQQVQAEPGDTTPRKTPLNIDGDERPPPRKKANGATIDDTINAVVAKHYQPSRH